MTTQMKTPYFKGPRRIEMREGPVPVPEGTQVLTRIKACGICAFDLHCYLATDEDWHTQGHEAGGVVEAVGPDVSNVKPGDTVAIIGSLPCGECTNCRKERPFYCLAGQGPGYICFADTALTDSRLVFPVPRLTCEDAALIEPLCVGMSLVHAAQVGAGDSLLLMGAGPIGLMAMAYCRKLGADRIYVSELSTAEARCALARQWGADEVLHPDKEDITARLQEFEPEGVSRVLITAKPSVVLKNAIEVAAKGAHLAYIGLEGEAETTLTLPIDRLHFRKMTLAGADPNPCGLLYPDAAALLEEGTIRSGDLISHRFDLSDIQQAFDTALECRDTAIKVMVTG